MGAVGARPLRPNTRQPRPMWSRSAGRLLPSAAAARITPMATRRPGAAAPALVPKAAAAAESAPSSPSLPIRAAWSTPSAPPTAPIPTSRPTPTRPRVCPFTIPMTTALQHPGAIITAVPASPRRCGPASSPWPTKDAPSQGWARSMAAPRPCPNSTSCRPPTSTTSPRAAPAPRPRTAPQRATTWPRASAAPWAICSFPD